MSTAGRTTREGLILGLIASACVAVFYGAFDVLAARGTLYTVNLLGKAVFTGARDPALVALPVAPDPTAIVLYSVVHVVLALAIGLVVTALVDRSEQRPAETPVIRLVIAAGFVVTVVAVGQLTQPFRPLLPWWSVVSANALAVVVAGLWLKGQRPVAWRRLAFGGGAEA